MHDDGYYCCLGVLTSLYEKSHPDDDPGDIWKEKFRLTGKVMEWSGVETPTGTPHGGFSVSGKEYQCLAEMNDEGEDFVTIANQISSRWRDI